LASPIISRQHARLVRQSQGYALEDLGSRNGTTPGGVPVRNVAAPVIGRAYEVFRFDVDEG